MQKIITLFILFFYLVSGYAQNHMRSAEELINRVDAGWPFVQQMIDSATNKVEVLSCDTAKINDAIYKTQVTTHSLMGAVIYTTGGILIDNGWIRILGSGNKKLNRSLPEWNKGKSFKEFGDRSTYVLIADDAVGGFFAVNGGEFGKDAGNVYYLSPDRLIWEPLALSYTEFLNFCFSGDLSGFYESLRWKNWEKDIAKLDGNKVYSFYPYLWSKEGKDINKNKRKAIPVAEQFEFNLNARSQLGLDKKVIQ
ncbi:MAG: DUF2625 domain-containing protein [Ferruginibacter sp.]